MSGAEGGRVELYFYGDLSCPFSYVAYERALRLREERGLRIHWRPLCLRPALPAAGLPTDQMGLPPGEWERTNREVAEMAAELELPYDRPAFVPATVEALQAVEFARDLGAEPFRNLHAELFRAYFGRGLDLGDREVLLELAEGCGLDRQALRDALEDGRYGDELRRVRREAERYDIGGTPTLLFGRHKVVGAAPMDVMRHAAERAEADGGNAGP